MTILNFVGFESGDATEASISSGSSVQSSIKRTGDYALRLNPSAQTHYFGIRKYETNWFNQADFSETTLYFTFFIYVATLPSSAQTIAMAGSGASSLIDIRLDNTGALTLYNGTSSSNSVGTLSTDIWYRLDLKAVRNGTCTLQLDEGAEVTLTGANNAMVSFYCGNRLGNVTYDIYYDDIVVDTTAFVSGVPKVFRLNPNAAGTGTGWAIGTGASDYLEVDEHPHDGDTTYWANSGLNDVKTVNFQSLSDVGAAGTILAVKPREIVRSTGTSGGKLRVRSGGSNFDQSTSAGYGGTYREGARMLLTDPNTSVAWTESGVNTLEAGPFGDQTAGPNGSRVTSINLMVLLELLPPEVTDVQPREFSDGELVEITGSNFGAAQGNGKVELGDNHQHNLANKVEQNIDHWEDLVIRFIANKGSLPNGQVFVFVTNDDGETNDPPPPGDPGDLDTEIIGTVISGSGRSNASTEKRLEIIYAAVAGHTAPDGAGRSAEFLMHRIGRSLGINITSGTRSFETNLILLYNNLTGETYSGNRSVNSILSAIESHL